MKPPELWVGLVNLKPLSADRGPNIEFASGSNGSFAGAFTNIVTWASDQESFQDQVATLAATLDMYVVEIERAEPVSERMQGRALSEEIEDLVQRAEFNREAIIYGAFYTYQFEDLH